MTLLFARLVKRARPYQLAPLRNRRLVLDLLIGWPWIRALLLGGVISVASSALHAEEVTRCTSISMCFCVNKDFEQEIQGKVDLFRRFIKHERDSGKAIAYLSIALSGSGGGNFDLNREIAAKLKTTIEARFAKSSIWVLNPADKIADLPDVGNTKASQADYMYMWASILSGIAGYGEDFDLGYFAGPSDFGRYFHLDGANDMKKLDSFFRRRMATHPDFKKLVDDGKLSPAEFRNYYAYRASVSFSKGAHDEWNIFRKINERRRLSNDYGITKQLSVFFDGLPVGVGDLEQSVSPGNEGKCPG